MSNSEFHEVIDALTRRPASSGKESTPRARTVAVFGAGPLAQLLACAALAAGCEVRLCSVYGAELNAVRAAGGITVRGTDLVGTYPVTDGQPDSPAVRLVAGVDDATDGADTLIVATSARAQEIYQGLLAPHLADSQTVVLVPGRFLGAAAFVAGLRRQRCTAKVTTAELTAPPYLVTGKAGKLRVHGAAQQVHCAAIPAEDGEQVTGSLAEVLPMLQARDNVLETSFACTTPLLHAVPALLNVASCEAGSEQVLLRDVLTPGIADSVLRRMDTERRELAFRYGVRELPPAEHDVAAMFGGAGTDLSAVVSSAEAFDELPLRPDIAGEVEYALVPLSCAGAALGVATPATDGATRVASALLGNDLARSGRTLSELRLDGYRPDELRKVLARRWMEPGMALEV